MTFCLPAAPAMNLDDPRPPRAAATLVVVRDAAVGVEVLLLRRAEQGDFNSGAWVFPGGVVDAGDRRAHPYCTGLDDAAASARLGVAEGGLDYWVAALRECFEEAALLPAACAPRWLLAGIADAQRRPLGGTADAARPTPGGIAAAQHPQPAETTGVQPDAQWLDDWRTCLHRGDAGLADLCVAAGWTLPLERVAYLSHWLTPPGVRKRFDTRFFVTAAPPGQQARHDTTETVEHRWLRPADALTQGLRLLPPTAATLRQLAHFERANAVVEWALAQREVPLIMPRMGRDTRGLRPVTPDEPAWAEIGRLDPDGVAPPRCDIVPGQPVRLSAHVLRVTAPNPGVMTGPGTNTYLVGGGPANVWAVIDPGPDDAAHVEAVLAAAPGPVRWILATHTHQDHSPAALAFKRCTAAELLGRVADHAQWQDATFVPDRVLTGGERLVVDEGVTLRAIHTPGHASNHLCYLFEQERTLFTGDHVMQRSTVVINPPDGDMAAYLRSLGRLLDEDIEWLAPGHGFLMAEPRRVLEAIVAHRQQRETKVIDALRDLGPAAGIEALLAQVYDDVPSHLHAMATRSLKAHLIKLRDEGVALERAGRWTLA